MKILEIRDNGGDTMDRYTVIFNQLETNGSYTALGMNSTPFHSIGTHCTATLGDHLGKLIEFEDLPMDCQEATLMYLE
ncbi:MAG: hypothetical protein MI892_17790 [Desulfobacterales bacterium]|nr:hypothetical protein [Desulfobacterales bacterium]